MSRRDDTMLAGAAHAAEIPADRHPARILRVVPIMVTAVTVALACLAAWAIWDAYVAAPWTRDGAVRAYVITVTPEVSGRIVQLPVRADQFVHKGDLLMEVDPTDYALAMDSAQASVDQARTVADNAQREAQRRLALSTLSTSVEEQQNYLSQSRSAQAALQGGIAALARARVNLDRTRLVSPVNGFVTNLTAQVGDYATAGQRALSVVDTDSFWVEGYFEETQLQSIHMGDPAQVQLMGYSTPLAGHVAGIARGIEVANAQPDPAGLASVSPVYTWIRLAQRIPVRIELDHPPSGITLAVGLTATVQIEAATGPRGPAVLSAAPAPQAGAPPAAPAGATPSH